MAPASRSRARHGLLAVSGLLALLLVAATAWSHQGVLARSQDLTRGQVELLGAALQAELEGPPTDAELQALVEAHAAEGLLWVATLTRAGQVWQQGGTPAAPVGERIGPEADLLSLDGPDGPAVRAFLAPEVPPPERGKAGPPGPGGPGEHAPPVPALVIDVRPLLASDLQARSGRTLAVSVVGALLLVAAALAFARQSARAEAAEADLEASRHLASLGQLSAVMAHEIRNPLASLKGHAQLLAELLEAEPRLQTRAQRVVDEALRLERLTNSLLDFARNTRIERVTCDPRQVARAAAQDVDAARITLDLDAAPAAWSLDPMRVQQVLVNLLGNALQASPPDAPLTLVGRQVGSTLVLEVRDRGPGVPPDQLDAIFEPFHTTRTQGTGLGLAVARRLARLHGGDLVAANHPDGGAVFTLSIPEA